MDATGDSSENSEKEEGSYRESFYCLRGYICYYKQNVARNINVKNAFYEVLPQAAITKYHRPGDLNNRHSFFTVLEAASPGPRFQQI